RAASIANPVDMLASASAEDYERSLQLLLRDERIDSVIVLFVPALVTEAADMARAVVRAASGNQKPVLVCPVGTHGVPEALRILREAKIPTYAFPEDAAVALTHAVRYGQWLQKPAGVVPELSDVSRERARAMRAGRQAGWLAADEVRALLEAYGIRMPRSRVVRSAGEAEEAARAFGGKVAVKLVSREIQHKTEVGGVKLGLSTPEEASRAFDEIRAGLQARGLVDKMD